MAFHNRKIPFCFKEKVSLIQMISLTELRAMLNENKIRGHLQYNKSELADWLIKSGLLPKLSRLQLSLHYLNKKIPRKKEILNVCSDPRYRNR